VPYTFVTDGVESAIAQAKAAAGDRYVALTGSQAAQQSSGPACSTRSTSRWCRYCSAAASACSTTSAARSGWSGPGWSTPGVTHLGYRAVRP
jgi:hypothetical protein